MPAVIFFLGVFPVFAGYVTVRVFSKYDIQNGVITSVSGGHLQCKLKLAGNLIEAVCPGHDAQKSRTITLFKGSYGNYEVEAAGQKRIIPGVITACLLKGEKGIVLITKIDIEDYVPCVLSAEEDDALYSPEFTKAHAIVIRTFAALNGKRHEHYDFCDLTHCEVFKGVPENGKKWYKAAKDTNGMILSGGCAKDEAYFSACCGGITENAGEFAYGKAGKCGQSIKDVYNGVQLCKGHRYFRWVKNVNVSDIEASLAEFTGGIYPDVMSLTISARTQSGRAKELKFGYIAGGAQKNINVDANRFFSVFGKKAGWALIPSKFFEVEKRGDIFIFRGRGHGHGVGMCLQGAHQLAVMGKNYREILRFYFPDLEIAGLPGN